MFARIDICNSVQENFHIWTMLHWIPDTAISQSFHRRMVFCWPFSVIIIPHCYFHYWVLCTVRRRRPASHFNVFVMEIPRSRDTLTMRINVISSTGIQAVAMVARRSVLAMAGKKYWQIFIRFAHTCVTVDGTSHQNKLFFSPTIFNIIGYRKTHTPNTHAHTVCVFTVDSYFFIWNSRRCTVYRHSNAARDIALNTENSRSQNTFDVYLST